MGIQLFRHNQKAYEAVWRLLEEEGRAAVVHPTGTGKSYIAFKLAEEHRKARICWLAPGEYMFQTQLKSLPEIKNGQKTCRELFPNLMFLTYAGLARDAEPAESYQPDYIILDEFHRCGAAEWGRGVDKLLAACPSAKVLGLSATNIRYLDGCRDMAQELFGGHIASELTLGEAIVRGILPAPEYVIALYSCRKETEKLRKSISIIKNPAVRRKNEALLEALRRSLEKADGLERVFARHMKKKDGRYLVFCADKAHLAEMKARAGEWFSLVDKEPHCYEVRYDSPEAKKEFSAFLADKSGHLKLLYCIDMLNEGVHAEGTDGVILLRPTVSPILYLQQIGRCLAAGGTARPVIFDIVNNFDALCTIDSLGKEIKEALDAEYAPGDEGVFHGRFRIWDETGDCRKMFEKLKKSLSSSWEIYYSAAQEYYRSYGHLKIPKAMITEDGLALGSWLMTQRRVRAGKVSGKLTEEQIERLNAIGMEWEDRRAGSFQKGFAALAQYKDTFGNADVKAGYVTEAGFPLGKWITGLRQKRNGRECNISDEEKARLDALGMIWDKREYQWERNFQAAKAFYEIHGNLSVPPDYRTQDGILLGAWILNQRKNCAGKREKAAPLSKEQTDKLNAIGMEWEDKRESLWEERYALAKDFYKEYGHLDIPSDYRAGGVELGKWIASVRLKRKNPASSGRKLTEERIRALDKIGMIWERDSWETRYEMALQYYREHGNLRIPADFVTENRIWLGKWLYEQRKSHKEQTLSREREIRLEKIGIQWQIADGMKGKNEKENEKAL